MSSGKTHHFTIHGKTFNVPEDALAAFAAECRIAHREALDLMFDKAITEQKAIKGSLPLVVKAEQARCALGNAVTKAGERLAALGKASALAKVTPIRPKTSKA